MQVLYLCEENYLRGKLEITSKADAVAREKAFALFASPQSDETSIYSVDGKTAHIAIKGELSNEIDPIDAFFGFKGTTYRDIESAIERAETDPAVEDIALDINSPGGSVAGVDAVWQAIMDCKKPVRAYTDGIAASAAYWIASAADKIIAHSITDRVGSIGVLAKVTDTSGFGEDQGLKNYTLVSRDAPAKSIKNEEWFKSTQAAMDATERIFHERVAAGRGVSIDKVKNDFGRGGLLIAYDPDKEQPSALKNGMIDGIESVGVTGDKGFRVSARVETKDIKTAEAAKCEGEKNMTLKEYLTENPAMQAEFDKLIVEAKSAACSGAEAQYKARVQKIVPILSSASYGESIKGLALKALSGESTIDALEAAVSVFDTAREQAASEQAQAECAAQGAPVAQMPQNKTESESLEMKAAMEDAIKRRGGK